MLYCRSTQVDKEAALRTLAAQNTHRKRKLGDLKDIIGEVSPSQWGRVLEGDGPGQEGSPEMFLQTTQLFEYFFFVFNVCREVCSWVSRSRAKSRGRPSREQPRTHLCCLQVKHTFNSCVGQPGALRLQSSNFSSSSPCRYGESSAGQHVRGQPALQPTAAHPRRLRSQRALTRPPVPVAGGGAPARFGPH